MVTGVQTCALPIFILKNAGKHYEFLNKKDKNGISIPIVFIDNYNMEIASLITQGVDLWLNTPMRPREASGTSGMKCALNGIMNFSVLDGWWIEDWIEDVTGWSIGPEPNGGDLSDHYDESLDAIDLYEKLEKKIGGITNELLEHKKTGQPGIY